MKKFRPFWSYQIEKTEQWLTEMAAQGFQLQAFQPNISLFHFEQAEPLERRFLIEYNGECAMYEQGGWQLVCSAYHWNIFCAEQPTRFSSRQNVFERLQSHYRWGMTLFAVLFFFLNTSLGVVMGMQFQPEAAVAVFVGLFLAFLGLNVLIQNLYDKQEQKYLNIAPKQTKASLRKRRIGWMYTQYITKRWLDRMFLRGYELDYVKGISFYFKPRESERLSYEILNNKSSMVDRLLFYQETGWDAKCLYSTPMWHISIWAKPYTEGERKPRISYVRKERLASVRRGMLVSNSLALMFVLIMWMNMNNIFNQMERGTNYYHLNIVMALFCAVMFIFWLWVIFQNLYGYWKEHQLAQRVEMEQS